MSWFVIICLVAIVGHAIRRKPKALPPVKLVKRDYEVDFTSMNQTLAQMNERLRDERHAEREAAYQRAKAEQEAKSAKWLAEYNAETQRELARMRSAA